MHLTAEIRSGHSFIDENHAKLIGKLEQLTNSLRKNWDRQTFIRNTTEFVRSLEEHFMHEETALRGAEYPDLEAHTVKHREIALKLRVQALEIHSYDTALAFAVLARSEILNHELVHDQEYWSVFESQPSDDEVLITWTSDLETGDLEIDQHHKALINYLNRLHDQFSNSSDHIAASQELRNLYNYSKLHFDEEEKHNKINMSPAHLRQHEKLLTDLDSLIKEVEAEEYSLEGISIHLKYWFIDHLRHFDIPTFKQPV